MAHKLRFGHIDVGLSRDERAPRVVAGNLDGEALDFGDEALLLEALRAAKLLVLILEHAPVQGCDAARELHAPIAGRKLGVKRVLAHVAVGARLAHLVVERVLLRGDEAARVDGKRGRHGRTRPADVFLEVDVDVVVLLRQIRDDLSGHAADLAAEAGELSKPRVDAQVDGLGAPDLLDVHLDLRARERLGGLGLGLGAGDFGAVGGHDVGALVQQDSGVAEAHGGGGRRCGRRGACGEGGHKAE